MSRSRTQDENILGKIIPLARLNSMPGVRASIDSLLASLDGASDEFLVNELRQIRESKTVERARYYIRRIHKALTVERKSSINDLNLNRWKQYEDILTDSLWVLDKRDRSGGHKAWYWGNFVPQIPDQLIQRYTKKGDCVLDPFVGSGTTLLECQRLGRNGFGIELQPSIAKKTRTILATQKPRDPGLQSLIAVGDSSSQDFGELIRQSGRSSFQLAILHPPYHDIIRFSKRKNDLSNAASTDEFISRFGQVVDNVLSVLDKKRYFAVVIGDKYSAGEWIPLGFLTMQETLKRACRLRSIVVKNFDQTTAKRTQKELWRYRALAGGFYVFKHEYILIFQKK